VIWFMVCSLGLVMRFRYPNPTTDLCQECVIDVAFR
jgi:hypothetical protein